MAMKKQWGSCSNKGNLMLNPHLVKAPKECIDYVILHELCHIAEHNHSERFWRLLTQVMPNWKEVKAKLDEIGRASCRERVEISFGALSINAKLLTVLTAASSRAANCTRSQERREGK